MGRKKVGELIKEARTNAGKTGTAKKPAVAKKTTGTSVKVTAKEKKVLELYRSATTDNKKLAVAILKGDIVKSDVLAAQVLGNPAVISNISGFFDNLI